MPSQQPLDGWDLIAAEATAFYLLAVSTHDDRIRQYACERAYEARRQVEEARPWYAGTWHPLPWPTDGRAGSDHG